MQPLYRPGFSFLHTLHPRTKLALVVLLIVATYVFSGTYLPLAVCFLVLALGAVAGVLAPLLGGTLLILAPLAFSLTLIQGVLFPPARTTPLDLGVATIWIDGLEFALLIIIRIFAVVSTVLFLILTTHLADLVQALTQLGLPQSVGYIVLVALQLVPDMSARATAIREVQQARGLDVQSTARRLRALPALVGPLIVGAIADVEDRAMALESRAFGASGPKTALRVLRDTPGQRVARWALLIGAALLVVARFTVLRGVL